MLRLPIDLSHQRIAFVHGIERYHEVSKVV
jgi:hypothetical protein